MPATQRSQILATAQDHPSRYYAANQEGVDQAHRVVEQSTARSALERPVDTRRAQRSAQQQRVRKATVRTGIVQRNVLAASARQEATVVPLVTAAPVQQRLRSVQRQSPAQTATESLEGVKPSAMNVPERPAVWA
jgi:hypothetical protein